MKIKGFAKYFTIILASFVSYGCGGDKISTFDGNQGINIKQDEFNPESFYGQWQVSSGEGFSRNWTESKFYTISFASLDFFDKKLEDMKNEDVSRTEMNLMWDNKDSVEKSLFSYAKDKYVLNSDNPNASEFDLNYTLPEKEQYLESFYEKHDKKGIVIKGYNNLGGIILSKPYIPYDFNGQIKRRNAGNTQSNLDEIISKLEEERPNFDFLNSVDVHFISYDAIYGLDIVDNDTIIFYNLDNRLDFVVFERIPSDKQFEVKTYNKILEEL